MKKKLLSLALVLGLLTAILSGCGNPSAAASSAAPEEASEATAPAAPDRKSVV